MILTFFLSFKGNLNYEYKCFMKWFIILFSEAHFHIALVSTVIKQGSFRRISGRICNFMYCGLMTWPVHMWVNFKLSQIWIWILNLATFSTILFSCTIILCDINSSSRQIQEHFGLLWVGHFATWRHLPFSLQLVKLVSKLWLSKIGGDVRIARTSERKAY